MKVGCGAWLGALVVLLTMYTVTLCRPELGSRQARRERWR